MKTKYIAVCVVVPTVVTLVVIILLWWVWLRVSTSRKAKSPYFPSTKSIEEPSYSATLLMQRFINESPIKSAIDPYLEAVISVGQVVVVIKPFYTCATNALQCGDLLRLTRIYHDEDVRRGIDCIKKDDALYEELRCKGIILSNYLEFEPSANTMQMKNRDLSDSELERSFPFEVISLEKTLLSNVDNQSPVLL